MAAWRQLVQIQLSLMVALWAVLPGVEADANDRGNSLLSFDPHFMLQNEFLHQGRYKLIMQDDCNAVLYRDRTALWASKTQYEGVRCYLQMQGDGNLVLHDGGTGKALWASGSYGRCPYDNCDYGLFVQSDGNAVVYILDFLARPETALWATETAGR